MPRPEEKPQSEQKETPQSDQSELTQVKQQLEEERKIRESVMQDPDFVALLKAKQEGKKVKLGFADDEVVEDKPKPSMKDKFGLNEAKPKTLDDLDRLSNSKLLDILSDTVEEYVQTTIESTVKNAEKALGKRFEVLESTQDKIKNAIIQQAQQTGAAALGSKYPDFSQYANDAFKCAQISNLSLEDAYLLVKAKQRGNTPPADETETERPLIAPTRMRDVPSRHHSSDTDEIAERSPTTRRGFRDALSNAFDRASRKSDFSR